MAVWQTVFKTLPVNEQVVWIRVLNIYGEPTLAKWDNNLQTFNVVMTGVVIPVYFIARWKSQ